MENVIRDNGDSIDFFYKNFEMDYSFFTDEPYDIFFDTNGSVEYIRFSESIDIQQDQTIRGVVHYINDEGTTERDEKLNHLLYNTLKFPFAIAEKDEAVFLSLNLNLDFKAGFVGGEGITNVLLSRSDYDIDLDFYRRQTGDQDQHIGTLSVGDYIPLFSRYDSYDLDINLKKSGLSLVNLFECFGSGKQLVINVTSEFKGLHQGKRLNGEFALEIISSSIDVEFMPERPSIDTVQLLPSQKGVQYINMTSDFMHNPYFADIVDLYGYDLTTEQLTLLSSDDYRYGTSRDLETISKQNGTYAGDLSALSEIDDAYLSLTSDDTIDKGMSLDYILNGPYVPQNPQGFNLFRGYPNYDGDYTMVDGDYTAFRANSSYYSHVADPSTASQSQYISSIDYNHGSYQGGSLLNTHFDDDRKYNIKSEIVGIQHRIDVDFNFNPPLSGRDFYLYVYIETTVGTFGSLKVNGVNYKEGWIIDLDGELIQDVDSISFSGSYYYNSWNAKIFYFKLVEAKDFSVKMGSTDKSGNLDEEGDWTTLTPNTPYTMAVLLPSADVTTSGWLVVGEPLHFQAIDEVGAWPPDFDGDGKYIYATGHMSRSYQHGCHNLPIGNGEVFTLRIKIYAKKQFSDCFSGLEVKYTVDDGQTYSTMKEISALDLTGSYKWFTRSWGGLSINNLDIDNLEVRLTTNGLIEAPGCLYVEAVFIEAYYTLSGERELEFTSQMVLDPNAKYSDDITLYYSYRFSEGTLSDIDAKLQVYNHESENWDLIDDKEYPSFPAEARTYLLDENHYSDTYEVLLRMTASSLHGGSPDYYNDFVYDLDLFYIYFENHTLSFTAKVYLDDIVSDKSLYYGYKTNVTQPVEFKIWNFLTEEYEIIDADGSDDFTIYSYDIESKHYNQDQEVLLQIVATNKDTPFELDVDLLHVDRREVSEKEATGNEKYWLSLTYKADSSASFTLWYGDDLGYHVLGTLDSTVITSFKTTFSPTLLDSRIKLRITFDESTQKTIYLDSLYLFSLSTDGINDLIIESANDYDIFYANLEFNNSPSMVDSHLLNVPLAFQETKNNLYHVFKISSALKNMPFIIDRVKLINPDHPEGKTVVPREYYHWVEDEIYVDSNVALDPLITQDSELNVDLSYIYDDWKENEYVDTQPYVHNFSISSAQRIEAFTFIVTYSEIPQIQSWFFGTMNDGESYKSLSNVLKKDVNLLDIQLYNHSGDKWETVGYVVYDLNDNDATTFGYFIDRNILDVLAFDGLPENDLIFQLKYRFKIEKNYFGELFSTKTFFDMQEVKVILSYSPIKSVVSLNPQLLFSVDVTDIIHPSGDDTITNHVNELSFDIDWEHDVSIPSDMLTGLDINEVFHDHVLYSNFISLNVTDKFGNLLPISSSNGKFYLRNTAQENIHDYIKLRHGRYFVDFLLYYRWDLKGLIKSVYGSMFNIQASIELTKCDVRAKVTTINKELITPISMPENGSIYVGDIFGDSSEDIGLMGGFLEKKENNDRFYVKYQFSYLYDTDDDDIFDEALDPRVYFAEHVQDACFSSSEVEGFLYYDGSNDKKKLILGDVHLFDLTTTSNVDGAYLYADLGVEVIGTTIYNFYSNASFEYNTGGEATDTSWLSPQTTTTVDRSGSVDWTSPNNAQSQDDMHASANLVVGGAGGIPVIESWTENGSTTASPTLTFTKPSGVQVGDLLVIIAMNDDSTDTDQFSDNKASWNFVADAGNSTSDCHVGLFWRIADGTEGVTESVTAQSSDEWMGFYVRISGADGTTPINVHNFAQSSSSKSVHIIPAVTTTVDDCLVLYGLSFDGGDGYQFSVWGTSWSEVDEYQTGTSGANDVSGCFGSRNLASQGSSGAIVSCSVSDGAAYFQIAIAPSGGGGGSVETDYLRCTNFGFSIPTGATIDGIEVEIDKHATLSSIKDYSIRLRDSSGQVGDNKSSTDWWDLTDDDAYNAYGGSTDTWNAGLTVSDINSADFGIDIAVKNHGSSNTAYVDHVRIKVYYTETPQQYQDSGIVRPDGDYVSPQWEGSHAGDHSDLINETTLDTSDYIYTSSNIAGSVVDEFTMDTLNVQGGNVTEITVKVYGNETPIESTINVYCGGWLGAKQLDVESGQGWYAYTWSGLSLSQSELDGMRIKFESPSPQKSLSLIGQFSAVSGTSNKFTYNWTGIESAMEGFSTGDETNITVKIRDLDSGSTLDVLYKCLLDFEPPFSTISIGDGQTDYSLNNFAAPWTLFDVSATDNLEGIINHDEYYYDEITEIDYQVKVHDMNNDLVHASGFKPLSDTESSLFDLGIPVKYHENHSRYYHVVEFRITDVAGNTITNSSYLGDSYSYDGGLPRILVSNEVTIQFENNLIDVNDLYDGIGNIINFTLVGPDGSELKNESIALKLGNYFLKTTLWNDTTQSYNVVVDSLLDLVLYSENIFDYQMYSNHEVDYNLNWYGQGDDYFAFARHASQEDPLILTYPMQKLKTSFMKISEKDDFRLFDYLNYYDVYCYIWNNDSQAHDIKRVFGEDDFAVLENGTVEWSDGVNLDELNAKDGQVIFEYFSSEHAHIIKDHQKNGMYMKILIPNMYSTHCTIDILEIQFMDFDGNAFIYRMHSLDFDEYFADAANYLRVIPGFGEILEIPIHIDFARLYATNTYAEFDIENVYSINFAVIDAPVWPGSISMHDPNVGFTVVNYPYQIFGVSEMMFYDIFSNYSSLMVEFDDYDLNFVAGDTVLAMEGFNSTITNLEVHNGEINMTFTGLNTVRYGDSLDMYFRIAGKSEPFPLHEISVPLMTIFDNLSKTLFGISLMEWDDSINKYHCKFTIADDVKEDDIENYDFKFIYFPTDVEKHANSSSTLSVDLLPQFVSKIVLNNERDIIFNEDYTFALSTSFDITFGEELELSGYVMDNSTYYRIREVIPYRATDPIGEYTLTEHEIDLHGLIGDSEFIDVNNFKLEYIDRHNDNTIQALFEMVDGSITYQDSRIEDAWIAYYTYYRVDHPNKFMLIINWTSIVENLISFDTDLLLTYLVRQGKPIMPATFEDIEDVLIPVDFKKYNYETSEWEEEGWFTEILNLLPLIENSSIFTNVVQDRIIQVDSASIGAGILDILNLWNDTGDGFELLTSSDYSHSIVKENGVDCPKVTYLGANPADLIIEYGYIPLVRLTHHANGQSLDSSSILVGLGDGLHELSLVHSVDYEITGQDFNHVIFYTFNTSLYPTYSLNDTFFIKYHGYYTEDINLVKNLVLEHLNSTGHWVPIAKVPIDPVGEFNSRFIIGEGDLDFHFPLNVESIMRLVYLPTNLTRYDGQYLEVDYSNFNPVYNTSQSIHEIFKLHVAGKKSTIKYISTDFSRAVDNWAIIDERKYYTTTNSYETLHVGEPYTALDFHRTITDAYDFTFQLVDEFGDPITNELVWMEIGWKPKAGLNYKVIGWEDENEEYIDSEALGTAWVMDDGTEACRGPGITDEDISMSRMFTKPETWGFKNSMRGDGSYSAYYWDYRITDPAGFVDFNVSFNNDYVNEYFRIFEETMFSSGSVTIDSLDDLRLYIRVIHAPIPDVNKMALTDTSGLLCSSGNHVFDEFRVSELAYFDTLPSTFYAGSYAEGLVTLHPEDIMLGVPNLLVYQMGSQHDDSFSFDVEVVEADVVPDAEMMSITKLEDSFDTDELIPEFSELSERISLEGLPIIVTITDYYGNTPFDVGTPEFIAEVDENGIATINAETGLTDELLVQLAPGVYRVNIFAQPYLTTKEAYRFCSLEVRPQNFLKFGKPTMNLDLNNWFDSGWGGAYFGKDYAFYEDIYPRLTGYLATLHSKEGISDYVNFKVFAKTKDIGSQDDWSAWFELGDEGIWVSSLVHDGLYYFEYPLGQDGDMLMGKKVQLNITANALYNKSGMIDEDRIQNLRILNLSLVTSTIRNDTEILRKYGDSDAGSVWIGETTTGKEFGVERYFEYTTDVDTYGIDSDDVLLTLMGFEEIQVVEVRGSYQCEEFTLEQGSDKDYTYTQGEHSIVITDYASLDDDSDLIISYAVKLDASKVMEWTFSGSKGFRHNATILGTSTNPVELSHDDFLGVFYSKFNETYTLDGDGKADLNVGFLNIEVPDVKVFNVSDMNGQELDNFFLSKNINDKQITIDFNELGSQDVVIEYGVTTYKLDRGYQLIGMNMSNAVRKLSKRHDDHAIYNYSETPEIELDLFEVSDDPADPFMSNNPSIIIPLLENNKTSISFNYLALLYDTVLNGSFYLDDCVLSGNEQKIKPVLATFTFTTEDGESYFDFVSIDPSTGENRFDFEITLQPIFATKGYTTMDVEIDFLSHGDEPRILQYLILDSFNLTADDRILQTVSKPMINADGEFDVDSVINTANYIQIFTDRLDEAYGVIDDAWLTLAVEGFDGYDELVRLYKDGDSNLVFEEQPDNEHQFQCLEGNDRRLIDSLGLHLDAYDLELPEYIEGEINLYAGKGKHPYGEVYVSDREYEMNWDTIDDDYAVDVNIFDSQAQTDYNSENFPLSDLPLTSQAIFVEGELYLHHLIDLDNPDNIIKTGLDPGVQFAVAIPSSTSRIESIDIDRIDRICQPWHWVESWQGYSLTEDDYSTYNHGDPDLLSYNIAPAQLHLVEGTDYDLVIDGSGEYRVNFYFDEDAIKNSVSSNFIQIDFHVNYEFSEGDYQIVEDSNTYNSKLHWRFPDNGYIKWNQFEYHPDLTDAATFNVSFSHLSDYAAIDDFKSTVIEEFQFHPNAYNFTEFTFEGFDDSEYEVTLNLTGGGQFPENLDLVDPFGMTIQTDSGERYLDHRYFSSWQHSTDPEHEGKPIFTFNMKGYYFKQLGILNDTEVLVTYYYPRESYEYYTSNDNILFDGAGTYTFIVRDDQDVPIDNSYILEVSGNKIVFSEDISTELSIKEIFTVEYEFKTKGGLLDTKHVFYEVQPYEMKFYNNYYPFSGGSIIAPLYYNLSANYQYQLALNYRLLEKPQLKLEFNAYTTENINTFQLSNNNPLMDVDDEPIVFAHFFDQNQQEIKIAPEHVDYDSGNLIITDIQTIYVGKGLQDGDIIHVTLYTDQHNKYQYYHDLVVDLTNDQVSLTNWTMALAPEDNLIANLETDHYIYGVDPRESTSKGRVKQVYAVINDTNSLTYYLTEDLNDAANGWEPYDTIIMKMGILNPDVLDYLTVEFYYTDDQLGDQLIGTTEIKVDMIDDSGAIYLRLPDPADFSEFVMENDARIVFTPVFYEHADFLGRFYEEGLPTYQMVQWNSEDVINGKLKIDLDREIFSTSEHAYVLNGLYELLYEISEVDTRTEIYTMYNNQENYELEFNNISLPDYYMKDNNKVVINDGDVLYLKYNAKLEKSIGLAIEDMILQKGPYMKNYDTGLNDIPIAEIALLGINNDGINYVYEDDLYDNREKLVAWESQLDLTPFESEFYNMFAQKVFNITFDDIYTDFKVLDGDNVEHSYITDVMVTSNDPRYQIVIDSIFLFEFDPNATLYDSAIFDIFPKNHQTSFYFGDYSDIYSEQRIFDSGSYPPIYNDDPDQNETLYFDAMDERGNWYYFNTHLFGQETSSGVYKIFWNPDYCEEYYYRYYDSVTEEELEYLDELYEYYNPHIDKFSYLHLYWADENAWEEWHAIESPNVNISTLDVVFEYYDETLEEYKSVHYNQTLDEFKARNVAVEMIYPYDSAQQTDTFDLSQDYSSAQNLEIQLVEGYFFNESKEVFDPSNAIIQPDKKSIEISAPSGFNLDDFEKIIIFINFTSGAYSDFAQFRLLEAAKTNYPEAPDWTMNDSIYVDFEYQDLDYFLLMEDYGVGSNDSLFGHLEYVRNDKFVNLDSINSIYSIDKKEQAQDFDSFSEVNDYRTAIEFYDFNLDGTHELIIQKDDITANGKYDSFKYGKLNPAGEISWHTLIQEATSTRFSIDKSGDVVVSDGYKIDWKDITNNYYTYVHKVITTETSTLSRIDSHAVLIQKDVDIDGSIDKEVAFALTVSSTYVTSYIKEETKFHWKPTVNNPFGKDHYGALIEYREVSLQHSDFSSSFLFRDYEGGVVNSTRIYDDIFPNELADIADLSNYLETVSNDLGDSDPSNDVTTEAPALEDFFSTSHERDGVPAIYDSVLTIENDEYNSTNILATERTITIPDLGEVTLDVIEVTPSDGVYFDTGTLFGPEKIDDAAYLYFDSNDDGSHETIFAVLSDEVFAVGFDYDSDGILNPNKKQKVEKHIISGHASGWKKMELKYNPGTGEFYQDFSYYAEDYGDNKLIHFMDYDHYDGTFLEATFGDSLFPLWKTEFSAMSSRLIDEVRERTHNEFIEMVWPNRFEDIKWQITAQLTAFGVATLVEVGLAALLEAICAGASTSGPWGYVIVVAAMLAYMITYTIMNSIHSYTKAREHDYWLKAHTFHNVNYEGKITLSEKKRSDERFGDSILMVTIPLFCKPRGIYTQVRTETDKYSYEGEVILVPSGVRRTISVSSGGFLGELLDPLLPSTQVGFLPTDYLDYSLQSRSYLAFSDLPDTSLQTFTSWVHLFEPERIGKMGNEASYMKNSIMYLEDEVSRSTIENDDKYHDRIIPYMIYDYPTLQFASSLEGLPLPEFYEDYPILVSPEEYLALQDEHHTIFKVYDGTSYDIQVIPEDSVHDSHFEIESIRVYVAVFQEGVCIGAHPVGYLLSENYAFDNNTAILTINEERFASCDALLEHYDSMYTEEQGLKVFLILDIQVEKYRSISDSRGLSADQVSEISTMQAVHEQVLEYVYQVTIGAKYQQKIDEAAYIAYVTWVSSAMTMAVASAVNAARSGAHAAKEFAKQTGTSVLSKEAAKVGLKVFAQDFTKYFSIYTLFAMTSEVFQELVIDPIIEEYVSDFVRKHGGSLWEQIFWATFAESARETLFGLPSALLVKSHAPTSVGIQISQDLQSTDIDIQLAAQEYFAELREARSLASKSENWDAVLSTLSLFGGVLFGRFDCGLGTSLASTLSSLLLVFGTAGMPIKDIIGEARELAKTPAGPAVYDSQVKERTSAIHHALEGGIFEPGSMQRMAIPLTNVPIPQSIIENTKALLHTRPVQLESVRQPAIRWSPFTQSPVGSSHLSPRMVSTHGTSICFMGPYDPYAGDLPPVGLSGNDLLRGDHPSSRFLGYVREILQRNLPRSDLQEISLELGLSRGYLLTEGYSGLISPSVLDSIEFNLMENPFFENVDMEDLSKITGSIDQYRAWVVSQRPRGFWRYRPDRPGYTDTDYRIRKKMWLFRELQASYSQPGEGIILLKDLSVDLFGGSEALYKRFYQLEEDKVVTFELTPETFFNIIVSVLVSNIIVDRNRALNALHDYGHTVFNLDLRNPTIRLILILMYVLRQDSNLKSPNWNNPDLIRFGWIADLISETIGTPFSASTITRKLAGQRDKFGRDSIEKILLTIESLVSDPYLREFASAYLRHYKERYAGKKYEGIMGEFVLDRQNVDKLPEDLRDYLLAVAQDENKGIPPYLLSRTEIGQNARVSSFNNRLTYISKEIKSTFIRESIGVIFHPFAPGAASHNLDFINDLIAYSKSNRYKKDLILGHGSPPHEIVLPALVGDKVWAISAEVPVYLKVGNLETLTGHIDLLVIKGDTIYVCDYKPDQRYHSRASVSKSFTNSVPQVATYALILKEMFGLSKVKCITFNQKGAWLFDPIVSLREITSFMQAHREAIDLPWLAYFPNLLK